MIGTQAAIQATLRIDRALQNAAALDLNRRMMLVREASLAMGLKHPNIVRTLHYGQHRGLLYIVVELLEGRSLDKVLPLHSAVPLVTKLRMIRQCAVEPRDRGRDRFRAGRS
jgi:serine/threonine protein kinase